MQQHAPVDCRQPQPATDNSFMPRPKVRPEERRRSALACLPCRSSKIRCDAQLPCLACIKRCREPSCAYLENSEPRQLSAQRARRETRRTPIQSSRSVPNNKNTYSTTITATESHETPQEAPGSPVETPECRMLLSSKGERVYIGETASISFLHFVRQILRKYMGPSAFTDNDRTNVMLEAEIQEDNLVSYDEDAEQRRALLGAYFGASSAILSMYSKEELFGILDEHEHQLTSELTTNMNHDNEAALYLALAIGRQCCSSTPMDLRNATKDFDHGRAIAFRGMLMDPSINLIRQFLLMAFYMLGACRRNAAFMYLGVASKAATALGLHIAGQYPRLQRSERDARVRTWKSLRILDLVVSSILGRPSSLPCLRSDDLASGDISRDTDNHRDLALSATYEVCIFTEEIINTLGSGHRIDSSTAELFLHRLHQWSQQLPVHLRQFSQSTTNSFSSIGQEQLIGNIHVSCAYYFTVILATRPFLISHLMSRLHIKIADTASPGTEATQASKVSQLSQGCIDAATYMSHMCYKAVAASLLFNNMCLLKAWVFAAGLVLGFSLFVEDEDRVDKENALNKARGVLKKLAQTSPQAEHYYQILTSFSEAITRHRQESIQERRRMANQYVDRILVIEDDICSQQHSSPESVITNVIGDEGGGSTNRLLHSQISGNMAQLDNQSDLRLLWDGFPIQFTDRFSFENESFDIQWDVAL